MTRPTHVVPICGLVVSSMLAACNGETLSFEPADSSTSDSRSPEASADGTTGAADVSIEATPEANDAAVEAASLSLPDVSLTELSDAQALQLCTWVWENNPQGVPGASPPTTSCVSNGTTPGYWCSGGFGCTGTNLPGGLDLFWDTLSPACCVLNLRHSPCAATTSAVEACVHAWATWTAAEQSADPNACPDLLTACAAFVNAPSCDETIFEHYQPGSFANPCFGCMPIEPGVSCPADAGQDAGTD